MPVMAAKRRMTYFITLIEKLISLIGITKLEMATAETMMIMMLDTSPASVAACPRINPPTVVAVEPIDLGSLMDASVSSSIIISMNSTSR
ncbi:Uncharacterised protein [Mycobacteroides abscessus subsp. abscessus]|nr:Uncharacterised protein [Mycobacteroides abscessus subsp. abscessus]